MKFRVRRTSVWDDETAPCPEATRAEYREWIYWTLPPAQIVKKHPSLASTTVEKAPGGSRSARTSTGWWIELDTLDDLLAFQARHGPLVIESAGQDDPTIEIYDDYRE